MLNSDALSCGRARRARRMAIEDRGNDQSAGYRLDDERRDRIRDCLAKAQISLPQGRFERLVRDIEASIDHFSNAPLEGTFRGVISKSRPSA
jgi:hypothetical protein